MASSAIEPARYDLIAICYYLQRDLFEPAKLGLLPGGIIVAIALLTEPGKDNSFRVEPGELPRYFDGWEILHHREGRDSVATQRRRDRRPQAHLRYTSLVYV